MSIDYSSVVLLNDDSPMVLQPKHIKIELKNHQKASIYAMFDKECNRRNGIMSFIKGRNRKINIDLNVGVLGDEVGKGKTLSTLGLISHDMQPSENNINRGYKRIVYDVLCKFPQALTDIVSSYAFDINNVYLDFTQNNVNCKLIPTNLIVVPHNLMGQWKGNIETQTTLSMHVINITRDSTSLQHLEKANVVLCNANKYNALMKQYDKYRWSRVIFDEADSINIPNMQKVNANFIWFVTTTFRKLHNHKHHGFIRTLFSNIKNDIANKNIQARLHNLKAGCQIDIDMYEKLMNHIVVKNCPMFVEKSFTLPNPVTIITECQTPLDIAIVKNAVDPITLNMLNAGHKDEAIAKMGTTNNLVINVISFWNNKKVECINKITHYNGKITYITENPNIDHPTPVKYFKDMLVKINAKIKECDKMIQDIKTRIAEHNFCIACLNSVKYPARFVKCCQIQYCDECYAKKCTLCDSKERPKKIKTGNDIKQEKLNKLENIEHIIKQEGKRNKCLIFSDYSDSFVQIKLILDKLNLKYSELKGNSLVINSVINEFRSGGVDILMLNSKHYGAGLNLQHADNIIVYHKLAEHTLEQVVGRAQRLGRTNNLHIYHLCYGHEI